MIARGFGSGEASPLVHHGLRLIQFGLSRGTLSVHPLVRTERDLDLVALDPVRSFCCDLLVIGLHRPGKILQMC